MKTSSPAEMVGSIDDLLTELFLRIPLKPLVQLKLVSKHWNTLISDPKLHSSRNKKPVGFIFQIHYPIYDFGREMSYILSLNRSSPVGPPSITEMYIAKIKMSEQDKMGNKFFHSCNGLLVGYLFEYTEEDAGDYDIMNYFVYNPTTAEYKSIPRPRRSGSIHWMYLAFDPSNSPYYKIVCVLSSSPWTTKRSQYKFAVYSSKTRSWKKYDDTFGYKFKFENGVYWNGSIHWISLSKTGKSIYFSPHDHDDDDDENVVVDHEYDSDDDCCYDADEDDVDCSHHLTVYEMPTPPILGDESRNYFGESCDHLNFISYYRKDEYKLKVYEMRRDYSEWFVKYCVDVSNVRCRFWNYKEGSESFGCPSSFDVCGLVRSKKGDDEDDSFLVLLIKRRMVVYNVVSGTFEIISEFDENEEDKDEEFFEGYEIFHALRSNLKQKYSKGIRFDCPLQYIESLCLV